MSITRCKIHPAIGVARVGDSRDEFFIGPERPGRPDPPAGGRYKDGRGHIKRQAARFRVFGYDDDGNVVQEITDAEAEIRWTVHLANRKAAAPLFTGPSGDSARLRNESVPAARRGDLVIDPGERTISGPDAHGDAAHRFDTGTFGDVQVDLGELRTDDAGRLLVLGGHGRSESPTDEKLGHFANNDGWFDDTSDGPVGACVTMRDTGDELPVDPSWVIVAPPDFAPSIGNVVTLRDVVEQVAFAGGRLAEPTEVSFEHHVRPLLERVAGYQWVDATALRGHRRGDHGIVDAEVVERRGDFLDAALLQLLSDKGDDKAAEARRRVIQHVRRPRTPEEFATEETRRREKDQATAAYMPPMSGDGGDRTEGEPATWLTVTPLQYRRLELWADGHFVVDAADTAEEERARDDDAVPTPAGLDRAALENCVGGGFYPGIEVSGRLRDGSLYAFDDDDGEYRLDHGHPELRPGALTAQMALPWQADFAACEGFWWPAQRPDHIVTAEDYDAVDRARQSDDLSGPYADTLAYPRRRWARGIDRGSNSYRDMVENWSRLGFVVPREAWDQQTVWTETERDPSLGLRDRDAFHLMLNLERYPDFRPVAKEVAKRLLAEAHERIDHDTNLDTELQFFAYDDRAFRTRLDSIYQYLVDQVAEYDPKADGTVHSHTDLIERIRQFAPLNQTDGAWLRNIEKVRPQTEVTSLLTQIWRDENGNGDSEYDHSCIYTNLMRTLGLDPAPVDSLEYIQDPELLDSAFTVPLLQFVVSEFTEEFLPEILGMTLHLEWESVYLKVLVRLFEEYGVDPRFYQLHLAIDNVAEGHGALAVRAVRRYLADFHGEELQGQWRRMWDGYVAFRESGTLLADLRAKLRSKADARPLEDRVKEMIVRKKPYGSLNHGGVTATGMTNDLFDDPDHMLRVLRKRRIVIDGRPDESPLLRTFAIDGRMYKVFTPDEQQLWREWITSLGNDGDGDGAAPTVAPAPAPSPSGETSNADAREHAGPRRYRRLLLHSSAQAFRADLREPRGRGAVQ